VLGAKCFVAASIGLTVFPRDGDSAETLLRNADIAMYRAKAAGRGGITCFEETMNVEAQRRLTVEQRLRIALRDRKLHLLYQPKISLLDGTLQGVEALARWNDEELGSVSPAVFIPIAEESGLIMELGAWALLEACTTFQNLQLSGINLCSVSVNASMRQLREPRFLDDVTRALAISGMQGTALEIEVTETMLADKPQVVSARLSELRERGVSIAIDDFGTGYSSMAALGSLPIDVLKIDRTFVIDCGLRDEATSVAGAIISMAHVLGKRVVAEGVETAVQLQTLRELGCDYVQGFLFARPMSAIDLTKLATTAGFQWSLLPKSNAGSSNETVELLASAS
jgi:EAL domain-containing protein (putative c-di-GMP-specific phosphodiesterase class I)